MSLNLAAVYRFISKELSRKRSLRESMDLVIGRCAKGQPHQDWAKLRELPYEDLRDLRKWIEKPFRLDAPGEKLAGLWFGLFNPVYKGKGVADLYVCGSKQFNANPEDASWAEGPPYWWPKHRYAHSEILAKIYNIAYAKNGLGNDAEYPLCLSFAALAVRDLLTMNPKMVIDAVGFVGIAVGFDSGDCLVLGKLTEKGLVPVRPTATRTPKPEAQISQFVQDLRSNDEKMVDRAAIRLFMLGRRAREAVPELVKTATTHLNFLIRSSALRALKAVAPKDPRTKAAALLALDDPHPFVKSGALSALTSFSGLSAEDLARIKNLENDPNKAVAEMSEIALRNIRLRKKAPRKRRPRRRSS